MSYRLLCVSHRRLRCVSHRIPVICTANTHTPSALFSMHPLPPVYPPARRQLSSFYFASVTPFCPSSALAYQTFTSNLLGTTKHSAPHLLPASGTPGRAFARRCRRHPPQNRQLLRPNTPKHTGPTRHLQSVSRRQVWGSKDLRGAAGVCLGHSTDAHAHTHTLKQRQR